MEAFLAAAVGLSLAATCGFRVFVPMLIAGLAARAEIVDPSDGFDWIGTTPALVAFAVATVLEIGAYYVPVLDNMLDTVASPLAVVAGILLAAASISDSSPLIQWSLAIIAGGGAAAAVQGGTVLTRLASTGTTGGTANFVVNTLETVASFVFAVLSILVPVLSIALLLIIVGGMYYAGRRILRRLFNRT